MSGFSTTASFVRNLLPPAVNHRDRPCYHALSLKAEVRSLRVCLSSFYFVPSHRVVEVFCSYFIWSFFLWKAANSLCNWKVFPRQRFLRQAGCRVEKSSRGLLQFPQQPTDDRPWGAARAEAPSAPTWRLWLDRQSYQHFLHCPIGATHYLMPLAKACQKNLPT